MFEYFGHFSKKFLNCTKTVLVAENKDLVIMKAIVNTLVTPDGISANCQLLGDISIFNRIL